MRLHVFSPRAKVYGPSTVTFEAGLRSPYVPGGLAPRGEPASLVEKDFTFENPWEPANSSDFLHEQIESELTPPHPLFGKVVKALAIRADSDDVLVKTTDGYALVHLSWCRRSQPTPDFPHTLILADWESFLDKVYEPDVSAWLEENPSDDWDIMIKEAAEGR